MQEQLISFETAKLAKEKGFDEACAWIYYNPPKIMYPLTKHSYIIKLDYSTNGPRKYNFYKKPPKDGIERYHACNQALLQKWLREVNNIFMNIIYDGNDEVFRVEIIKKNKDRTRIVFFIKDGDYRVEFNTYEEALETGLKEALKLIITL